MSKEKALELIDKTRKIDKHDTLNNLKSNDIIKFLTQYKSAIAQALPKHLTAEKMIMVITSLITRNPNIANCTAESLIGAMLQASILGFEPIDNLGLCYFIPYYNSKINKHEIEFQISYQGYLKLMFNSPVVKSVWGNVVYNTDVFNYEYGLHPKLIHIPDFEGTYNDNDITHSYVCVELANGSRQFVVLSRKQIEKLRNMSPSQSKGISGAWKLNYSAMAIAKAVKVLAKFMPKSIELAIATNTDGARINFNTNPENIDTLDIEFEEPQHTVSIESPSKLTEQEKLEYQMGMEEDV